MEGQIVTELRQGILTIRINRPEKKNALTIAMYEALTAAIRQADADSSTRVLLVTGTSDCFTAGNDLIDFIERPPTRESSPVFQFLKTLMATPKPVVAAVQGVAVGIGTTMLLHCDLVYAGRSARFQLPFVNLALVPEAASSLILPGLRGHRRAAEWLMLGRMFDADEARDMGIVNAVCPDGEVLDVAWQTAQELASKPPVSLRLTKALMKRWPADAIQSALSEEGVHFIAQVQSAEALEAMQAVLERRKPDFSQLS